MLFPFLNYRLRLHLVSYSSLYLYVCTQTYCNIIGTVLRVYGENAPFSVLSQCWAAVSCIWSGRLILPKHSNLNRFIYSMMSIESQQSVVRYYPRSIICTSYSVDYYWPNVIIYTLFLCWIWIFIWNNNLKHNQNSKCKLNNKLHIHIMEISFMTVNIWIYWKYNICNMIIN